MEITDQLSNLAHIFGSSVGSIAARSANANKTMQNTLTSRSGWREMGLWLTGARSGYVENNPAIVGVGGIVVGA